MSRRNSAPRRSELLIIAALFALPCGAQLPIEPATAGILSSAIDALANEQYGTARSLVARLERERLSPFERSRVEQILFNVAYHERRYDDAQRHLLRSIDAGGLGEREVEQARYQRAQMLMAEERWADGIAALEAWLATAVQPESSAYYLLAVGYYQSGAFAKALPAVRAAIERMEVPQENWLTLQLAVHLQQEQLQDAVPILNRLITLAPDKKSYWLQLSSVYGKLEDYANALAVMQVAYEAGLLTESAEILRLTDLLLYNEVPLRAAQVLEESITAGTIPADENSYAKLGSAWIEGRDFDRAVVPLERAAEIAATGDRFVRLGEVHMEREDWTAAETTLTRAVAKGGLDDAAYAQMLLGMALFAQRRPTEAKFWFDQARNDPRHHDVSERYIALIAAQGQRTPF